MPGVRRREEKKEREGRKDKSEKEVQREDRKLKIRENRGGEIDGTGTGSDALGARKRDKVRTRGRNVKNRSYKGEKQRRSEAQ